MRARARWGIAPLLAAPAGAWALGFGDIELQSALNQPFRAEIVLSATAEEMQSLRVTLATPETFERYGLDRPGFLSSFEFRVVADRSGRNTVQITSRESIPDPFVTLLLEATTPRGRTLREYTVLLDPPVLLPAPAVPPAIQPAESRAPGANAPGGQINRPAAPPPAATTPAPAPAPRQPAPNVSSTAPSAPRTPVAAAGGVYGPVQRAETLWAIADRLRPEGVTINQMMIAIYQQIPLRSAATSTSCAPAPRCGCPSRPTSTRWRRPSPTRKCSGRRTSGRTARRKAASCACCRPPRQKRRERPLLRPRPLHPRRDRPRRRPPPPVKERPPRGRRRAPLARSAQCRAAELARGCSRGRGRGRARWRDRSRGSRRRARVRAVVHR